MKLKFPVLSTFLKPSLPMFLPAFLKLVVTSALLTGCQSTVSESSAHRRAGLDSNLVQTLPKIVSQDGRHMMTVGGKPFLMLAAQTNNSANYPSALEDVWPVVEKMQANTLGIPVAWEQIEPVEGQFDFSYLDALIAQAKQRDVRVVLLWFATWKNNAPHYAPAWVKLDNKRFPRVVTKDGRVLNSLSPLGKNTLAADKKAFQALMTYLRDHDPSHQVILVQVQNEVGTYGAKRDYSAMAQEVFNEQVPARLLTSLGATSSGVSSGSWQQVFGEDADEFFHAWHIGTYVDEIAAAGKAIKNLPMNVNVALRNPFNPGEGYSMGGPTDNVIDLWKVAAPNIDMISPDIYFRDHKTVSKVLELYSRSDNPLFVAEIGNDQPYARYFFSTLGEQGIGFAPFGMDYTDYANFPLGAKEVNDETIAPFADNYALMAPWAEKWAQLSFQNETWGVAEPADSVTDKALWNAKVSAAEAKENAKNYTQQLDLGDWNATVTYGRHMFWIDPPVGNSPSSGGALIAKLSNNEYLITGVRCRVELSPSDEIDGQPFMIERVEEGHFNEQGEWVFERVWNGDQTDWGLNFTSKHHILKVKMATYEH